MRIESILKLRAARGTWDDIVTISPEQARQILEQQPTQRPINQRAVDTFADAMRAKQWEVTHQGIAADERGLLLDGQHRLWACFLSGIPLRTRVFFNEPRAHFDLVDQGTVRTVAQLAVMKGQFSGAADANSGTAAARFLWAYDLGKNPTIASSMPGFSARVADEVLARHPMLMTIAPEVTRARLRRFSLPRGASWALFTMFAEASETAAMEFLHEIATGENLAEGDPALALRNMGIPTSGAIKPQSRDMVYRLARAWNARVEGRHTLRLYGANTPNAKKNHVGTSDVFPTIAGYRRPSTLRGAP